MVFSMYGRHGASRCLIARIDAILVFDKGAREQPINKVIT